MASRAAERQRAVMQRGSASATTTNARAQSSTSAPQVLQLRTPEDRNVMWAGDTIDNEDMGKKKSNKCCIYHKPREFGESSSDSGYESSGRGNSETSDEESVPKPAQGPQVHRPVFHRTGVVHGRGENESSWAARQKKRSADDTTAGTAVEENNPARNGPSAANGKGHSPSRQRTE